MFYSIFCKHFLYCSQDRSGRVANRDVGQGTQGEIRSQQAVVGFNKVLPHQSSRSVVREWEVNGLVKELFELLLGALQRLTRATDDRDPGLKGYELGLPLFHGFLDSGGVGWVRGLLLFALLLAFLLRGPYFFTFVDIND